jgi:hypothetical protein
MLGLSTRKRAAMARYDYSDDEDFFDQGFERDGVVSVWLRLEEFCDVPDIDALQDYCGIGYYNVHNQEAFRFEDVVPLHQLFEKISYSRSFALSAINRAKAIGVENAYWLLVQFDLEYDPLRVQRKPTHHLLFIGTFPYVADSGRV